MNLLIEAIRRRDGGRVQELLEQGEDANAVVLEESPLAALPAKLLDAEGLQPAVETPLLVAAQTGQEDMVRLLLEYGAEVDFCPPHAEPALCIAASGGSVPIVALLLDRGANIEAKGTTGRTALLWAARTSRIAVVQLLLDRGAQGGERALQWAEELGFTKLAELLRARGYALPENDNTLPPDPFANPRRFYREG